MEKETEARYLQWLSNELYDKDLKKELDEIKGNEERINDAFYRDLEFGTGGLRGVIGAGTNRMNVLTVAKASQGYSDYLNATFRNPSVAIAHDSRIKSDLFSETAASVFAANGIKVHMYPTLMPTPSLSFAVRHLHCSGGIVVTASHNPAKYNGYKVYGPDGCQITTKAAEAIQEAINNIDIFTSIKRLPFDEGIKTGIIEWIGEETVNAFINAVSDQSLLKDNDGDKNLSIVYTPLNGAGLKCVTTCLKKNGYTNIHVVKEQEEPDGNFPTCPYPNPEIREALELGLRDVRATGSDILIATDPDSDRVGIAVPNKEGDYTLLTGNETGVLLLNWIATRRIELGKMPAKPVMVKTIVTTDMATKIAQHYGIEMREVLTGFKYIGEQIGLLEKDGEENRYILGFEESYGYLTGSYVRDKDAVDGAMMIADMTAYYRKRGKSLLDVLAELYAEYGYFYNTLHSYEFDGEAGFEKMKAMTKKLRNEPPTSFAGSTVITRNDYLNSISTDKDGNETKIDLPVSDVMKFITESGISVVVRPSGTEPKLKIYFSIRSDDKAKAAETEKELRKEIETFLGI
ncbi:MAG: phospho-sugar mutase [Spirochaetes bacterium]|uniref:Phospho-sugar mutase n=1 Tax=Candidatus Ornithospirochaeta stercoripullorum TaxID=2840899 RepID=A0A9D9E1Q0_9SPIO|nr:phospho-sugar mutase [Candidatus Ornithospirochaeta stercoripullorum]